MLLIGCAGATEPRTSAAQGSTSKADSKPKSEPSSSHSLEGASGATSTSCGHGVIAIIGADWSTMGGKQSANAAPTSSADATLDNDCMGHSVWKSDSGRIASCKTDGPNSRPEGVSYKARCVAEAPYAWFAGELAAGNTPPSKDDITKRVRAALGDAVRDIDTNGIFSQTLETCNGLDAWRAMEYEVEDVASSSKTLHDVTLTQEQAEAWVFATVNNVCTKHAWMIKEYQSGNTKVSSLDRQ